MKKYLYELLKLVEHNDEVSMDKLKLDKKQFYELLELADREGYIEGINFARGGQGNPIIAAFIDNISLSMRGYDFIESYVEYSDDELYQIMLDILEEKSGGKKHLNAALIRKELPERLSLKKIENMLNDLVESNLIRKVKSPSIGRSVTQPSYYYEFIKHISRLGGENANMNTEKRVFIIHGHDENMKINVQLLLERAKVKGVVLHERPDRSRTIIDKLIEESQGAVYAIALFSPDDKTEDGEKRARQNVILELGYFIGLIGKQNVRILYKDGTSIPSDIQGVLYEPYDSNGNWKMRLLKEMKEAGVEVDIENAMETL